MKIQIKITQKEKHILLRILSVLLILMNVFVMWFGCEGFDNIFHGLSNQIIAMILLLNLALTSIALFNYYK